MDAQELGHFGNEPQKYAAAARDFLTRLVMRKQVTVDIHGFDRYDRAVGTVYVRGKLPFWKRNASLELLKSGHAVVYKGVGAEYGGCLGKYIEAEAGAKWFKRGMWKAGNKLVLPSEYKKAIKNGNGAAKAAKNAKNVAKKGGGNATDVGSTSMMQSVYSFFKRFR